MRRDLILYVPVIHKGYLDLFERRKDEIERIYLISDALAQELSQLKPDIASLSAAKTAELLHGLGYADVRVLDQGMLPTGALVLVNDQVSRALAEKFFKAADIEWEDVFLRWDKDSVYAEEDPNAQVSRDTKDVRLIQEAQDEAKKSSDWWRQVGAVVVKEGAIVGRACNEGMPSDHTPYQRGGVRDFVKTGERPELSDTIHAEQKIVAEAAYAGLSLKGATLYVTHFPCPVCAKLIARSGIARCCFYEGSSSLQGGEILRSGGVDLVRVEL